MTLERPTGDSSTTKENTVTWDAGFVQMIPMYMLTWLGPLGSHLHPIGGQGLREVW